MNEQVKHWWGEYSYQEHEIMEPSIAWRKNAEEFKRLLAMISR